MRASKDPGYTYSQNTYMVNSLVVPTVLVVMYVCSIIKLYKTVYRLSQFESRPYLEVHVMFNNLSSKPSIIIKAFLPVYGNRLPGHDLNTCLQLASVVMLFLRVEERGREPGEQEETRGEQEVG